MSAGRPTISRTRRSWTRTAVAEARPELLHAAGGPLSTRATRSVVVWVVAVATSVTPSRKNRSHASQVALGPHALEVVVVDIAVTLEVEAQIEQRLSQDAVSDEEQA